MKDLILNFSLDRLLSLPPTEFLAVVVLLVLVVYGIYKVVETCTGN